MPDEMQITSPYDNSLVDTVPYHDEEAVRWIIGQARDVAPTMKKMTAHRRARILERTAELIRSNSDELAELMVRECGKPMKYARGEVNRATETFTFAADAARSLKGETVPMDAARGGAGKIGYYVREPVGVIGAITPFNFPLNLVAHKVAPAVAAGCPIVLKPSPRTPLSALRLADMMSEAGLPDGAFGVVLGDADVGEWLTTDERIAMLSFTGSPGVANAISKVAGIRRTVFELGGNAATVITESADMQRAVSRCVTGSFAYSGQVCISVQRIYVHQSRYDDFLQAFLERTAALRPGDPLEDETDIGPMIDPHAAERVSAWVDEAVQQGAEVAHGHTGDGQMLMPTVLIHSQPEMRVMKNEVFGPVVNVLPYTDFDAALDAVNDSEYGLQAGVFTKDLAQSMQAVNTLDVGGVMINDVPTFRVDQMPYGGNKHSGIGREGPRFAIEEMTTIKMVVINT
jgi:acyl-CoA reductase-like NAD-dependent aldehyde dehydrogenase